MAAGPDRPVFFYDLGSPYAYLAAERVNALFAQACGEAPEWQPILLGALLGRFGRDSWANGPGRDEGMKEIERRASGYDLPRLRWPEPFPGNTLLAMRSATYAKEIGRAVSFSLAAFRQAFAAGRDLTQPDNVLLAAAASELHPRAILAAVERDSIKRALREATERAGDLGVRGVPSVVVGGQVFWGDDQLQEAAVTAARLAA
jgi:2-hydroxychromene-2-carboxylate isomerase